MMTMVVVVVRGGGGMNNLFSPQANNDNSKITLIGEIKLFCVILISLNVVCVQSKILHYVDMIA